MQMAYFHIDNSADYPHRIPRGDATRIYHGNTREPNTPSAPSVPLQIVRKTRGDNSQVAILGILNYPEIKMKPYALFLSLAIVSSAGLASNIIPDFDVNAANALAKKRGCMTCHDIEKKKIGPRFTSIADKYAKHADPVTKVAAFIKSGGKGSWGKIPMPPTPNLTEAEATMLAKWAITAGGTQPRTTNK